MCALQMPPTLRRYSHGVDARVCHPRVQDGGAVYVSGSRDVSIDGAFTECKAGRDGGAVHVESSGDVLLDGTTFSECEAGSVHRPPPPSDPLPDCSAATQKREI